MIPTQKPQNIYDILKLSLIYYIDILKVFWPLAIGLAVIKNIFFYLMHQIPNIYLNMCFGLLFVFIALFIFSMMLYQADRVINDNGCTILQAAKITLNRYLRIVLSFTLICCLIMGTFLLARLLIFRLGQIQSDTAAIILFLIIGFLLLIEILYCFFVVPLIAVKDETVFFAFKHSAEFLRKDLKLVCTPYFFLVVFVILISPSTKHYQWLSTHFLSLPFDIIVFTLLLPLILNIILFTIKCFQNDLR